MPGIGNELITPTNGRYSSRRVSVFQFVARWVSWGSTRLGVVVTGRVWYADQIGRVSPPLGQNRGRRTFPLTTEVVPMSRYGVGRG